MNPLAAAAMAGSVGTFTIGSADIDARAQGVATVGKGNVIRGFKVTAGSGDLVYVDDRTGATVHMDNVTSGGLQAADDMEPAAGPLAIRTILGTSNATPSGALTLRCVW
jgi:hypothetical protein